MTAKTPGMDNSVVVVYIKGGAHHLDLRGANSADTEEVRAARTQIKAVMRAWVGGSDLRCSSGGGWTVTRVSALLGGLILLFRGLLLLC